MAGVWRKAGHALERLTGAEVREREWPLVLLFFSNLFILLAAYYILKVVREPLILLEGGAIERSYARASQAGLLLVLLPSYGYLADRLEPAKLVKWVMGSFVACVAAFVALGHAGVRVGFAFFVWLGLFSTLAIAQFWSLATDVLSEPEGKRLFPVIAAGGTLGGIAGAQVAAHLMDARPFPLMLVAAALLVSCALLTHMTHDAALVYRRHVPHERLAPSTTSRGLWLVLRDRYLLLIAASVLLLNLVNTTGDYVLAQAVSARARGMESELAQQRYIAGFYGDLQAGVAVLAALVQTLLVARVFKKVSVTTALAALPLVVVVGYGLSAAWPTVGSLALVKLLQDGGEYSLHSTSQQALFLPTSKAAKYQAKAAIDTLFVRMGDLGSALVVVGGSCLGLGLRAFALTNALFGLVWLLTIVRLRRQAPSPALRAAQLQDASP